MALFRRDRRTPDTRTPDPTYPQLSVDDVTWIRATGHAVLAGHGREVTVNHDGTVLIGDGLDAATLDLDEMFTIGQRYRTRSGAQSPDRVNTPLLASSS